MPWYRVVAVEGRESEWRVFGKLQGNIRDLRFLGCLWSDTAGKGFFELGDHLGIDVLLFIPQSNEILELFLVFRAIVEGGSACDQTRQYVIPGYRKLDVAVSRDDMVKHIIQNVQQMKSASFQTRPRAIVLQTL